MRGVLLCLMVFAACDSSETESVSTPAVDSVPGPTLMEAYDLAVTALNQSSLSDAAKKRVSRDDALAERVTKTVAKYAADSSQISTIRESRDAYALVLDRVRTAGLPDAVAAIPFTTQSYTEASQGKACGSGVWQLQPLHAVSAGLKVAECTLSTGETWTPEAQGSKTGPPRPDLRVTETGDMECLITNCATDERTDIKRATDAVVQRMTAVYQEEQFKEMDRRVETTILAQMMGRDAARYMLTMASKSVEAGSETPENGGQVSRTIGGDFEPMASIASVISMHLLARCVFGVPDKGAMNSIFKSYQEEFAQSYCAELLQ